MNYLIVGLGNIGPEYLFTRHNIGFMAVDYLARQKDIKFSTDRLGSITSYKLKGKTIYLLKPNTYMNLSGKSVLYWSQQLKIENEVYYWSAESATSEIDFVLQHQNQVIPIEVKAEENLKSKLEICLSILKLKMKIC